MKIVFDTLAYASKLKSGGVDLSDVHAKALAEAIADHIYTKSEIDKMNEAVLRSIEETLKKLDREHDETAKRLDSERALQEQKFERDRLHHEQMQERDRDRHDQKILEVELRFERTMNRYTMTTIGVLGSLIVAVGAISTLSHYFFH